MTVLEHRLCVAGIALFFFGLLLGFGVPAFPDKHAVLAAHQTALGSGTFLIAMGLIWNKLAFSPRWSVWNAHLLWIAFFVLQAGLTLGAAVKGTEVNSQPTTIQSIAALLTTASAVLMFAVVAGVVVVIVKTKPQKG